MEPNLSSNIMRMERAGSSFIEKLIVSALVIALLLAALPVRAAFAATSGTNNFAQEWSNKLQNLKYYGSFYERVRVYPADFEDPEELAEAHDILNQYGVALRGAQTVVANHTGFDQKGKVVNDIQAEKSLKALSEQLRLMRVLKARLDRLEGNYRLLPVGAATTSTAQ